MKREKYLRLLNLREGYNELELKSAYKKLVKIYHPDSGGSHEEFLLLKDAYEYLLKNPKKEENISQSPSNPSAPRSSAGGYNSSRERNSSKESIKLTVFQTILSILSSPLTISYSILGNIIIFLLIKNEINPKNIIVNGSIKYEIILIYLALLLYLSSLIFLYILIYNQKLIKTLRLNKIRKIKLHSLRNNSIIIFSTLSIPSFITVYTLKLSYKIFKYILNKFL